MQELRKRITFLFSKQEHSLVVSMFPQFLDTLERQGADSAELQALSVILRSGIESNGSDEVFKELQTRVMSLLETVLPDPLTLEEASEIYGVKAATLRRACWSGKIPAKRRGKAWFVNSADLEQYLATNKKKRTRRSP